jgi:hypothetical protein
MALAPPINPDPRLHLAAGESRWDLALRGLWGNLHTCARKSPAPVPEGVLTTP